MLFLIDKCLPAPNMALTLDSITTAASTLIQGYQTGPRTDYQERRCPGKEVVTWVATYPSVTVRNKILGWSEM